MEHLISSEKDALYCRTPSNVRDMRSYLMVSQELVNSLNRGRV